MGQGTRKFRGRQKDTVYQSLSWATCLSHARVTAAQTPEIAPLAPRPGTPTLPLPPPALAAAKGGTLPASEKPLSPFFPVDEITGLR